MQPDDLTVDVLRGLTAAQLRAFIDTTDTRLKDLHQDNRGQLRDLSEQEQRQFDDLMQVRDAARERLGQHERVRDLFGRRGGSVRTAFGGTLTGAAEAPDPAEVRRMSGDECRDAARRMLEDRSVRHVTDSAKDRLDELLQADTPFLDGGQLARRTLLTETEAYRSAWRRVMTQPRPILTPEEVEALRAFEDFERAETRGMTEGTPSAGGVGVPVFIDPSIVLTAQENDNPYLRRASIVNINTNQWKGVNSAGVTWSFDAEGAAVSDDSPSLGQPTATVYMARGFVPYSIEVGQDYPGFAQEMAGLLAAGWDDLLINKLTSGNGTTEPKGILTALSANTNVRVMVTTSGAFGVADINKVWAALPRRFRNRATWFSSITVQNQVRQFGATYGANFSEDLSAAVLENLYGRPYEITDYLPALTTSTTANQAVAVVGDFANFAVVQRAGMTTELVPTLLDTTTGRPTGQRGWFSYARVGSTTKSDLAFRVLTNVT